MTWSDITLGKYLQLHPVIENDWNDYDKFREIVYILTGKYEDIYTWSEDQIKQYTFLFKTDFEKNIPIIFKAGRQYYKINADINRLVSARYIEAKTFYANGYIQNLHKIIASFIIPVSRWGFKYRNLKYEATKHEQYANDILNIPFPLAYNLGMHFLNIINTIDKNYPLLFDEKIDDQDERQMDIEHIFQKYYGWIYSTTQVAEHERITLDQAFELPVMQFLNDLAYLKMKGKLEKKQIEDIHKKK